MRATDPRTRIARRLLPAAVVVALLIVSAAQAQEGDPAAAETGAGTSEQAQPPTPVPTQEGDDAVRPEAPAEQPATAAPAAAALPAGVSVSRTEASATRSVSIVDFAFRPASLTVEVGDTVRWTNEDSAPHDVTGDGLDSGRMEEGDTFIHTFKGPGTVNYICTIHPSMKASVRVRGAASGGGAKDDAGAAQQGTPSPVPAAPAGGETAAAAAPPGAGGGGGSLPVTGEDPLGALAAGLGLLLLGLALRPRPSGAAANDWLP